MCAAQQADALDWSTHLNFKNPEQFKIKYKIIYYANYYEIYSYPLPSASLDKYCSSIKTSIAFLT